MASSEALTTTHLPHLRSILDEWKKDQSQALPKGFTTPVADLAMMPRAKASAKDVVVAFRTRPPLPGEAYSKFSVEETTEPSDCDASDENTAPPVEFCAGITVTSAEPGIFVAHVPGMKWSGPTLTHKSYEADLAFAPGVDNEEFYQRTVVANGVLPLVLSGGVACVLAYGQTGTGKTFSMEGIESRIARDLFETARTVRNNLSLKETGSVPINEDDENGFEFNVTFLELLGKHATDLVQPAGGFDASGNPIRKDVAIREDKIGNVCPDVVSTTVRSSTELEALIVKSLAHRRTSATHRNASSSRSHALLTIRVKNKLLPYAREGQLILVDLAGSERYEDSKGHDKQRMEESRENNNSLMNLKECVRAKAKMANEDGFVHIPWRSNKLTKLLKPIFDIESRQPSKTIIIAHVSPHIQDTAHSTNTLSYAAPFKTSPPKPRGPAPYDAKDPRTWNHSKTHEWLTGMFAKRRRDSAPKGPVDLDVDIDKLCPPGMTASNFGAMYTTEFVERCLDARRRPSEGNRVKEVAMDIIMQLTYIILKAKTKTRNDIMKSRKKVVAVAYESVEEEFTEDDRQAQLHFGLKLWQDAINVAVEGARQVNASDAAMRVAYRTAANEMVQSWKQQKLDESW